MFRFVRIKPSLCHRLGLRRTSKVLHKSVHRVPAGSTEVGLPNGERAMSAFSPHGVPDMAPGSQGGGVPAGSTSLTAPRDGPYFPTPAYVRDYTNDDNFQKWSQFISGTMTDTVKVEEKIVGTGKCQFYNPDIKPAESDKITAQVTWNGFPRRLELNYPKEFFVVADKKDGWPFNNQSNARNQDEYLEWYVYKNSQGKITRVDFTCEGPEYFELLFNWEPETCLKLYREFVSPNVKMEDLYTEEKGQKEYNMYNKWNTTDGCMHLNCPPNSLGAEIRLAGDASIIRQKDGVVITDSQALINCSKYGRADRNSDPHIGSTCNTLCRDGKRITLANPVCLFIAKVNTSGWTTPDRKDASKYMKLLRGTKEQGLRYSLQVPSTETFTVGDIMIGGEPIQYGGSIAKKMTIGLIAEVCTDVTGAQPAYACVPDMSKELVAFHPMLKAKKTYVARGYQE